MTNKRIKKRADEYQRQGDYPSIEFEAIGLNPLMNPGESDGIQADAP